MKLDEIVRNMADILIADISAGKFDGHEQVVVTAVADDAEGIPVKFFLTFAIEDDNTTGDE